MVTSPHFGKDGLVAAVVHPLPLVSEQGDEVIDPSIHEQMAVCVLPVVPPDEFVSMCAKYLRRGGSLPYARS